MRMATGSLVLALAGCSAPPATESSGPPPAPEEVLPELAQYAPPPPPRLRWEEIGVSVQGRPIRTTTIGRGPRKVLWIGGIHGNEREGSVATAELPAAFLDVTDAPAKVALTVVEDVNPDGTAMNVRGNANGVDLNRNYPADNFDRGNPRFGGEPLSQPEARVLHDLILSLMPDLVIVAHSWRGDHFVNYDGPAEDLARLFSVMSGYRMRASDDISPTPGSLGSWVGRTLGLPILTLEYERGMDPEQAWDQTRLAILGVILAD